MGPDLKWRQTFPRQMGASQTGVRQPGSRAAKLLGPGLKWRRAFPRQMGARQPRPRAAKLKGPDLKWRRALAPQADGSQAAVIPSSQTHGAGSEVAPGVTRQLAPHLSPARREPGSQ